MKYRVLMSCLVTILSSSAALAFLYRQAESLGLVDRPGDRKRHAGNIPLIGGLSALFGVVAGMAFEGESLLFSNALLGTGAVLALVGALDDRFDLSVRSRLLVQAAAVITMIYCTGVYIHTLGHLFGREMELGALGIPLTLFAVIGLLNAINMMDGIDGLAGMLTLVSIGAIAVFQGLSQWHSITLLLLLAAALLPDLAANLELVGRKVFLGDAGSMMIGYFLAWTLIQLSQQPQPHLSTVDVLWCVALPVLDTLQVMLRRVREGKSPFKPDRGHVHHIMLNAGFSAHTTLVLLVSLAIGMVYLGTWTRHFSPGSNLLTFATIATLYIVFTGRAYRWQLANKATVVTPVRSTALPTAALPLAAQLRANPLGSFERRSNDTGKETVTPSEP